MKCTRAAPSQIGGNCASPTSCSNPYFNTTHTTNQLLRHATVLCYSTDAPQSLSTISRRNHALGRAHATEGSTGKHIIVNVVSLLIPPFPSLPSAAFIDSISIVVVVIRGKDGNVITVEVEVCEVARGRPVRPRGFDSPYSTSSTKA
jgi:hypothetical protein